MINGNKLFILMLDFSTTVDTVIEHLGVLFFLQCFCIPPLESILLETISLQILSLANA